MDFGKGLITLCEEAFSGCYNLTELALPNSLITIGDRAFRGLNLSKVDFGKGVTTIGEQAFQDCYNLTEVKLPASVITIKTSAFEECANLTTLVLPEKIKTIGERAFANCYSLSALEIPGSVTGSSPRFTSFSIVTGGICVSCIRQTNKLQSLTVPILA